MNLILEEQPCFICKKGIYNNEICPCCNGFGYFFRIKDGMGYVVGSKVLINYKIEIEEEKIKK
jgi:hypothetical protein